MINSKYQKYLKSPEWQRKRLLVLDYWDHKCAICFLSDNLHVHHRTYKRLYNERLTDFIPLCSECHELFSERFKQPSEQTEHISVILDRLIVNAFEMAGRNG